MSATQLTNGVRPWHEELLEFIIAHPRASGAETAFYFGVTESWLSIVKNSDAFKELWAQRRPEHFSRVSAGVSERLTALAEVSLNALSDKVEKENREGNATIATLRETADMALKNLGFGNKTISPLMQTNVQQNNNFFVDRETLARARETKTKLQETIQKQIESKTIEGEKERKAIE